MKQEVVRLLANISPSPANDPSYDPLRPRRHDSTPFVRDILERLGITVSASHFATRNGENNTVELIPAQQETLRHLNVIHVAGTKGKGSTCRLVSAFLEAYYEHRGMPKKICMLTGPHLLSCTERIQINSKPISEEAFAEALAQVYTAATRPPMRDDGPRMTQLVALTAIHYAVSQGADFFICEAFCGG